MVKVEAVPPEEAPVAEGGALPLAMPLGGVGVGVVDGCGVGGGATTLAGAQDTIYLCNFRVSVDGEWLCLKELHDVEFSTAAAPGAGDPLGAPLDDDLADASPTSPDGARPALARDPVFIERRNLLNISKLIVKELIETSLRFGRMLDSDHLPLQHFFIVLEHVLRHGLRPKKGLLGPKKELWGILQSVEQHCSEAADITASVRDLPTVRTHMGRARAWLRLALMQKKLADYLKVLVDHREDLLAEYYEPDALLMSDEAVVIVGLLVGLNVIDCNLCVKEEDLDCQQGVIDFSLYLRSTNHSAVNSPEEELDQDNMTMVLDQKNYIEELNRHLNATVTNLQAKVEALMTTNALMKEDLAIAKNNILALQEENHSLRVRELPPGGESSPVATNGAPANDEEGGGGGGGNSLSAKELEELRAQLEQERKSRLELEKELDLQVSLKAEMEVAMKLLEQDIHEKQDTIISLRRQLDDIKLINLEMYKKLQECEQELTEKGEMVTRLQAKTTHIGNMLNNLEKFNHLQKDADHKRGGGGRAGGGDGRRIEPIQCHGKSHGSRNGANGSQSASSAASAQQQNKKCELLQSEKTAAEEQVRFLSQALAQHEAQSTCVEGDLRVEREWRNSLQESMVKDRDKISQLHQELAQLRTVASKYVALQEEHYALKEICSEQERTLEELGVQLSASKLQVADLQEEANRAKGPTGESGGQWANDRLATQCRGCNKEFNLTRRKHHCRNCGEIFCNSCSDNTMSLPSSAKPVRVCDECHIFLVGRYSVCS